MLLPRFAIHIRFVFNASNGEVICLLRPVAIFSQYTLFYMNIFYINIEAEICKAYNECSKNKLEAEILTLCVDNLLIQLYFFN